MPVLTPEPIEGDAPLIFDGTTSFVGGMVSNTRANLLTATQSAELVNFDLDQTGQLVTRRGTQAIGSAISANNPIQGLFYYDTPSVEELLAVCNTRFYHGSSGTWTGPVSGYTASSASLRVNFAQLLNNVYFVDGSGKMYRWDGSALASSNTWAGVTDPPPDGLKFLVEHQNRIAAAGDPDNPETIYFSDDLNEEYPTINEVQVGDGTGDPITGIISWIDYLLIVFKERSIYLVDTALGVGADASIRKIHDTIGCVAHRTIRQVAQDVFFLSSDGIRSVSRTLQNDQQTVTPPLSFDINDLIVRINSDHLQLCSAIFHNNRYIVTVPLDTATEPDTTLVYHTINQSLSGYWTGWTNRVYEISAFGGVLRLVMGNSDGQVLQWLDYVPTQDETDEDFEDNGEDISTVWKSRAFIFGEILNPKFGSHVEFEFFQSLTTVDLSAVIDGGDEQMLASGVQTFLSPGFAVPFMLPLSIPASGIERDIEDLRQFEEFRELQIVLRSDSGKVALRSVGLAANLNALHTS